jgi:cell division protein FtsB
MYKTTVLRSLRHEKEELDERIERLQKERKIVEREIERLTKENARGNEIMPSDEIIWSKTRKANKAKTFEKVQ